MGILSDTLRGVGYALDTPGALLRGLLSGRPGSRATGREMLDEERLLLGTGYMPLAPHRRVPRRPLSLYGFLTGLNALKAQNRSSY